MNITRLFIQIFIPSLSPPPPRPFPDVLPRSACMEEDPT